MATSRPRAGSHGTTTRIFGCHGLGGADPAQDRLGVQDLVAVLIFGALAAGWYFGLYKPQQDRNQMLRGRLEVLQSQQEAEALELRRIRRELADLRRGTPGAWERAARRQLGWLSPGEVVNVEAWRREALANGHADPMPRPQPPAPRFAQRPAPNPSTTQPAPEPAPPPMRRPRPAQQNPRLVPAATQRAVTASSQ